MNMNLKIFGQNLVFENTKIISAIKILNQVKYKTLIIIDKKKKVIGSVTDGDIRRGLLKGFELNQKIKHVAEKNSIKKIIGKKLEKTKKIKIAEVIPVVNSSGIIKDLEIIDNKKKLIQKKRDDIEIILMAGGFGKRLMPYTKKIPKPLLKINNESILELAMKNFSKFGINKFKISIYHKAIYIKNFFKKKKFNQYKIEYLEEKKPLGTAGCLTLLNYKDTKKNIIVYNGDVITDININNLIKFHEETKSDITVCAKQYSNASLYGEIFFRGHKINKIVEKPIKQNFFNAGIYVLKKNMIKNIPTRSIDMTSFIEQKIKKGFSINIYPIYEYWVDIGNKDIFKQLIKKN